MSLTAAGSVNTRDNRTKKNTYMYVTKPASAIVIVCGMHH